MTSRKDIQPHQGIAYFTSSEWLSVSTKGCGTLLWGLMGIARGVSHILPDSSEHNSVQQWWWGSLTFSLETEHMIATTFNSHLLTRRSCRQMGSLSSYSDHCSILEGVLMCFSCWMDGWTKCVCL